MREQTVFDVSVDALNEGALIVNADGVVLFCNNRFSELVRMPTEQIVGSVWTEFFQDYELALLQQFLGRSRYDGSKERFVLRPKDSRPASVQVSARSAVLNGLEVRIILVFEQGYEFLMEGFKDSSIIILDPKGRITYWNMGAQQMNSFEPEEVLGKSLNVLYPPEDQKSGKPYRELEQAAARGSIEVEGWRVRKDGTRVWVNSVITALRDATGTVRGYIRVARDITAKKRAEENLRQSEMELKQAQRLALVGSWEWLPDMDDAKWSDEMYEIMRRDPKEGPINYRKAAQLFTPETLKELETALTRTRTEGTPSVVDARLEFPDGTRWVSIRAEAADRDHTGKIVKLRGTLQDITERRLGEELRAGENRVLGMIANRAPLRDILKTLAEIVEAQSRGMLCSILLLDEKGQCMHPVAGPSLPEAYIRATDGLPIGPNSGSCGTAAFEKKQVIAEDLLTDPRWTNYRFVVATFGLRACWSTPILSHRGKVLGTFAMYYKQPRAPGPPEFRLIETATNIAKIAIEHQQADDALRQSEERFRTAFAGAAVGMAIVDLDGCFREVNQAYSRITGYSSDELIGKGVEQVIHPEDREMTRAVVGRLLAREIPNSVVQKRFIAKGGGVVWVQNSLSLLCDSQDRPAVMLLITEDITQRKRAEDELRRREEQFRTVTELVPGFIFTARPDGWADYFNQSFYEYTGLPQGSLSGDGWKELVHAQDLDDLVKDLDECLDAGTSLNHQLRVRGADGTYRWFLVRTRPIRDPKGRIIQWLGTATDIEEQKRAEEILEERVAQRTAKLRDTVEELEQYSYSITHDLRAPLRAIQGFARLLEEEGVGQISEATKDYLKRIAASTRRMDNLIRDSLNYGKIIRTEMHPEPVNMAALVREVIQAYPALQPPQADVSAEGDFPMILGNDSALSQCVSNLLLNAVKFVAPGTHPRVRVWSEIRGEWVRLWVEDNGIGIATESHEQIFGMFQQLSKAYEGTGVGLAIVRKAAERMGGKVGVESKPGAGSRFWVDLKRAN